MLSKWKPAIPYKVGVEDLEQVKITVQTRAGTHTVVAATRANLLQAVLAAGVPFRWSCSQATCGKCQCQVLSGAEHLQRPTANEPQRLSQALIDLGFRLACQAKTVSPGEIVLRQL